MEIDMAKAKSKKMSSADEFKKVWTQPQREAWLAVGAFIYKLRCEGKIAGVRK